MHEPIARLHARMCVGAVWIRVVVATVKGIPKNKVLPNLAETYASFVFLSSV